MKDWKDLNRAASPRKGDKRVHKVGTGSVKRDGYSVLSKAEDRDRDDRKPLRPAVRQKQMPNKDGHFESGENVGFSIFKIDD